MLENGETNKIRASVANFYESNGASFASTRSGCWVVMNFVRAACHSGDCVIDVGAGNARLAASIPADMRYVAIEPSSTLCDAARSNSASRTLAEVRPGGFPQLPAKDGEADVTACIAVLHHLSRDERRSAMQELARITRPGGTLVLTVMNLRSVRWMQWKIWLASWCRLPMVRGGGCGDTWVLWKKDRIPANRYFHAYTLRELRADARAAHWDIEQCVGWGEDRKMNILFARNLLLVAKKRLSSDTNDGGEKRVTEGVRSSA